MFQLLLAHWKQSQEQSNLENEQIALVAVLQ